jgi:hypothetical protein
MAIPPPSSVLNSARWGILPWTHQRSVKLAAPGLTLLIIPRGNAYPLARQTTSGLRAQPKTPACRYVQTVLTHRAVSAAPPAQPTSPTTLPTSVKRTARSPTSPTPILIPVPSSALNGSHPLQTVNVSLGVRRTPSAITPQKAV